MVPTTDPARIDFLITELAVETHKPREEVEAVFNEEMEKLRKQAKVKTFLPLIARRLVKQRLASIARDN